MTTTTTDTYTPTRSPMTRGELAQHATGTAGRDSSKSDDGYSDMEVAEGEGWTAISGWGADGWDLLDWPYYILYVRRSSDAGQYQLRTICEGDSSFYGFATCDDLYAAIDYLWAWAASGNRLGELLEGIPSREMIDSGWANMPTMYRGPYGKSRQA